MVDPVFEYSEQEYVKRLSAASQKIHDVVGNRYVDVDIQHDKWCRVRKRTGFCNCDPFVFVYAECGTFQVMRDGSIEWRLDMKNPYVRNGVSS